MELIGKYMIDSPKFASDYYQKIADRIAVSASVLRNSTVLDQLDEQDTGLGVRKRVIKLLKSFYAVTDDRSRRIDICTRIVLRMLDEDDTVKDLAIKTTEELWFQGLSSASNVQKTKPGLPDVHLKTQLLSKVAIIMGVSSHFKDKQSPLEDMLHQIMADKEGSEATMLHSRYAEICETLIDGLVDASDLPGFVRRSNIPYTYGLYI